VSVEVDPLEGVGEAGRSDECENVVLCCVGVRSASGELGVDGISSAMVKQRDYDKCDE